MCCRLHVRPGDGALGVPLECADHRGGPRAGGPPQRCVQPAAERRAAGVRGGLPDHLRDGAHLGGPAAHARGGCPSFTCGTPEALRRPSGDHHHKATHPWDLGPTGSNQLHAMCFMMTPAVAPARHASWRHPGQSVVTALRLSDAAAWPCKSTTCAVLTRALGLQPSSAAAATLDLRSTSAAGSVAASGLIIGNAKRNGDIPSVSHPSSCILSLPETANRFPPMLGRCWSRLELRV